MSLLHDIRQQPPHVRSIFFGLSALVAVALVGGLWLDSFKRDVFVLLNPDSAAQEQYAAVQEQTGGPLAFVERGFEYLRATITGLFGTIDSGSGDSSEQVPTRRPFLFPVSADR